jgi:hypothetical protein
MRHWRKARSLEVSMMEDLDWDFDGMSAIWCQRGKFEELFAAGKAETCLMADIGVPKRRDCRPWRRQRQCRSMKWVRRMSS